MPARKDGDGSADLADACDARGGEVGDRHAVGDGTAAPERLGVGAHAAQLGRHRGRVGGGRDRDATQQMTTFGRDDAAVGVHAAGRRRVHDVSLALREVVAREAAAEREREEGEAEHVAHGKKVLGFLGGCAPSGSGQLRGVSVSPAGPLSELEHTAERLLELAHAARGEGRSAESRSLAEAAIVCASSAGASTALMNATRSAALFSYAAGDLVSAERDFRRAGEAARAAGEPITAARFDASIAFLAYDRGDSVSAQNALDAIDARLAALDRRPGDVRVDDVASLVVGYRGNLARQGEALDEARALYVRAIESAPASSAGLRATFEMDLAAAELLAARPLDALRALDRAERESAALPHGGDARILLPPLLAHYRALARLAVGERADLDANGSPSLAAIRAWLSDATRGGTRAAAMDATLERRLARLTDDASDLEHSRVSLRIVRTIARAPVEVAVLVARDGSSLVCRGRYVDLSRRAPLMRALERIVRAHRADPSTVVSLDELVRATWPGERIQAAAARNRIHVALATLRTLGLGGALVRVNGGYRLAPEACRVT
jgi:tetratricopeptide (TPR) repeat protein